ncbi:hypothetical protein KJ815_02190, partial [bacterium]|nr:hypothetical protein [bacterium]
MQQRTKAVIVLLLGIFLVISYWGCDLMDGDFTENQIPEVIFVNVPTAGDTFNYAPVVHWTGHDPDGQIVQYQYRYRGDTTQAAFDAYAAWIDGNAMALTRYCDDHPAIPWEAPTESTEDTIYLKRNEADSLTRTVFMIRCFDNLGGVSLVKGKLFSRTNQAPFAPRIKWARDTELETERGFLINYSVSDTLLWGDTLTLTYPGIGFLWQGRDPDSRALNIIPLRFSYLLVNETTGDTMPYPMRDDENRIVGYRIGWSDTTSHTQVTFTSANVTNARRFFDSNWNFELDGSYRLKVEVFDDGFTKCDTPAVATFSAVRPLWNDSLLGKQLLLVDWNKTPTSTDYSFGLTDDQIIRDFYESALPEGFALGEQLRQAWYPTAIPKPFEFTPDQVQWHEDKVICEPGGVPYDRIRYFKWIWIINDNPPRNPCSEPSVIYDRLHVLQEYMNSGGQVMISGRGLFYKTFGLANPGNIDGGNPAGYYLRTYHNLTTIYPKVGVIAAEADFNE